MIIEESEEGGSSSSSDDDDNQKSPSLDLERSASAKMMFRAKKKMAAGRKVDSGKSRRSRKKSQPVNVMWVNCSRYALAVSWQQYYAYANLCVLSAKVHQASPE